MSNEINSEIIKTENDIFIMLDKLLEKRDSRKTFFKRKFFMSINI